MDDKQNINPTDSEELDQNTEETKVEKLEEPEIADTSKEASETTGETGVHTKNKEANDCSPCDGTPWDSKQTETKTKKKENKSCSLSKIAIGLIIALCVALICVSVQLSNLQEEMIAMRQEMTVMNEMIQESNNDAPQQSINDWLADRFQSFSDWLRPDVPTDHVLPEETEPALEQPAVDDHTTATYTDPDKSEVDHYLKQYLDTWIEKNRLDEIIPGDSEFHFSANIDGKEYDYDWSSDQQP